MSTSTLIGTKVVVLSSDPWDFVTEHGPGPFTANVLRVNESDPGEGALLVQLQHPLIYRGIRCEYFVVSPRHEGDDIASLAGGKVLPCGLTQIPADRVDSTNPFDLSWWRGGVALLGSVRKL